MIAHHCVGVGVGLRRGPDSDRMPKPGTAVRASGTSLTGLFGVGPVIAAAIIGEVRDVSRFKNRPLRRLQRHRADRGLLRPALTHREALRSLKRQISDAAFACLRTDARRAAHGARRAARGRPGQGPGRAVGERLCSQRGRITPQKTGSSGKPLRGLATTLRPWTATRPAKPLDTKRHSIWAVGPLPATVRT